MFVKTQNQGTHRHARRRAERVPDVAARHQHHPMLGAMTPTLLHAANEVVVTYDDDETFAVSSHGVLVDAEGKVGSLHDLIVQWSIPVRRDVPGFEADRFTADKHAPDDVQVGAKLLLDAVRTREAGGSPLAYATELTASVDPAMAAAAAASDAAKAARAMRKQKRRALREAVTRLHVELKGYRRVLGKVIGREHPDYRTLLFRPRPRSNEAEPAPTPNDGGSTVREGNTA